MNLKRGFLYKRGEESLTVPQIMFLVLNILFVSLIMIFVFRAASGATIHEQVYAKQIALLLDNAFPGMEIELDFENGFKIAEKNRKTGGLVSVQSTQGIVEVRISSTGGYRQRFFTDYSVLVEEDFENKKIIFKIGEKNEK
jgi:hypothetical protein